MEEIKILLIEDHKEMREKIVSQIRDVAKGSSLSVAIEQIDEDNVDTLVAGKGISNEMALANGIRNNYPDVALIVLDHDLSNLKNSSISESSITAAAHTLAIPVCRYHRKPSSSSLSIDALWELNARVYTIDLDPPSDEEDKKHDFGTEVIDLLEGFRKISEGYKQLDKSIKNRGAPAVLSHILKKPGMEDYFAGYSEGIPFLNDMLIVRKNMEGSQQGDVANLDRRIPYMLGYWLHNFILRFPGVILNEIATASYLNIDPAHFRKEKIRQCFERARYEGPFSKSREYWWRPMLDDLLIENGDRDEILKSNGLDPKSVPPAKSHISDSSPAGYYDIFSDKPISKEDSIGSLSWIPSGADLARVAKDRYEEIAPILGI